MKYELLVTYKNSHLTVKTPLTLTTLPLTILNNNPRFTPKPRIIQMLLKSLNRMLRKYTLRNAIARQRTQLFNPSHVYTVHFSLWLSDGTLKAPTQSVTGDRAYCLHQLRALRISISPHLPDDHCDLPTLTPYDFNIRSVTVRLDSGVEVCFSCCRVH